MSAATHIARPVGVLVQDGGAPDAAAWANVVANGMVSIDPNISGERRQMAMSVRQTLGIVLCEAFHEATAKSSKADILALVAALMPRVLKVFAGTPWEMWVESPVIQAEFERYLTANLAQAAHLNLMME